MIASTATAQGAPAVTGVQGHVLTTISDEALVGGGLGVEVRTAARVALIGTATVGRLSGSTGFRGEGLIVYRVTPGQGPGLAAYGGGGVTWQRFAASREYLVAVFGVERSTEGGSGWFVEIGVGGGLRTALGFRIRPS